MLWIDAKKEKQRKTIKCVNELKRIMLSIQANNNPIELKATQKHSLKVTIFVFKRLFDILIDFLVWLETPQWRIFGQDPKTHMESQRDSSQSIRLPSTSSKKEWTHVYKNIPKETFLKTRAWLHTTIS